MSLLPACLETQRKVNLVKLDLGRPCLVSDPPLLPELCSVGPLTAGTTFTLKGKEDECG